VVSKVYMVLAFFVLFFLFSFVCFILRWFFLVFLWGGFDD